MSTEDTAPQLEDTPANTEAPEQETDWRKRYEDLQPEYTRSRQILTDEQQLLEHIGEKFPHLMQDEEPEPVVEDDEDFEDDTPAPAPDPRIDALVAWQAEQQYEKDLQRLLGDRELDTQGRTIVEALSRQGGHNADSLKKAVETWFEVKPVQGDEPVPEKPKRQAPHVPAGGKAATGVPNYTEMTEEQAIEAMVARARALDTPM